MEIQAWDSKICEVGAEATQQDWSSKVKQLQIDQKISSLTLK